MPVSNYPNGFSQGITIRGALVEQNYPGEVFWVNNTNIIIEGGVGGSDANAGTYQEPFMTIDHAIGVCRAGRGDIILVMPGHSELIESTFGEIICDVAGVAIIGMGAGTSRPTITFSTGASAISVSAANVTWKNFTFVADVGNVVAAFIPTAVDLTVEDCEFKDNVGAKNFVYLFVVSGTDNIADDLKIINCSWVTDANTVESVVDVNVHMDGLTIRDCYTNLNPINKATFAQVATSKDLSNVIIENNTCIRLITATSGDVELLVSLDSPSGATGVARNNTFRHFSSGTSTPAIITTGTAISMTNNLVAKVNNLSGLVIPAIDS